MAKRKNDLHRQRKQRQLRARPKSRSEPSHYFKPLCPYMTARFPSDDGHIYRAANAADKCIRRHYVVCSTAKSSLDFGRLGQVNSSPAPKKEDFSGWQNGRSPTATADQCLVPQELFCMTCLRRAHYPVRCRTSHRICHSTSSQAGSESPWQRTLREGSPVNERCARSQLIRV